MSTRSSIAVQKSDGTVEAVYCHFDGYLDGVGATLKKSFATQELAEGLVALGDLSSVMSAENLGEVKAYSRDLGEPFEDVAPRKYSDMDEYYARVGSDIGDNGYRYIFSGGKWLAWGPYGKCYYGALNDT